MVMVRLHTLRKCSGIPTILELRGKTGPAPVGSNYPPGTQVGDNGIRLRPARGNSGPRIDIPVNGGKPHETLHYPN
jgi:hypothetical protein